jgi:hypothetical protein
LFALAVAVLLVTAACSSGSSGNGVLNSDQGLVRFVVSAESAPLAPATLESDRVDPSPGIRSDEDDGDHDGDGDHRMLQAANVTFTSILARNLDGQLIDVAIELPATVDLLALRENGRTVELPIGVLPPGIYDQLVVVMSQVELITLDGTSIVITPPGGGWTAIIHVCPFEVIEGETVTVQLRFKHRRSFDHDGLEWRFRPAFECE